MFSSALSRAFGLPYSGHGPREVNRQRLAHLLGFERRVIQHFTPQLVGFDGLANQRIFLLIT